ncbi:hypothetical protein [Rubidibacter lacunae]|uniref:hypothetical protein n=1 Tax=Rubidibacter lacunae TaxID=582514 RepID=UPI0018DD838E|nr:hypothetical protein [Rubidibacter lacunae]
MTVADNTDSKNRADSYPAGSGLNPARMVNELYSTGGVKGFESATRPVPFGDRPVGKCSQVG